MTTRPDAEVRDYIVIVSMDAKSALSFAHDYMGVSVARVAYQGQADPSRYRFGARVYHVFPVTP